MPTFSAWQPPFLATLAKTGNVRLAAQRVHLSRQNAYLARSTRNRTGQARLQALAFAQCWQLALQESILPFQEALYDRAMHGVERQKPIYYKGKQVGVQKWTVYNDSLLIHLLKSIDAEIYKANALPEAGDFPQAGDLPAQLAERETLENLTNDLWCQVFDILDPASKEATAQSATSPEIFSSAPVSSLPTQSSSPVPRPWFSWDGGGARRAEGVAPAPAPEPPQLPISPEIFSPVQVSSPAQPVPTFSQPTDAIQSSTDPSTIIFSSSVVASLPDTASHVLLITNYGLLFTDYSFHDAPPLTAYSPPPPPLRYNFGVPDVLNPNQQSEH